MVMLDKHFACPLGSHGLRHWVQVPGIGQLQLAACARGTQQVCHLPGSMFARKAMVPFSEPLIPLLK